MKKLWIAAVAVLGVLLLLYIGNSQALTVRSYVDSGTVDEEQVVQSIEAALSNLSDGINNQDAEQIFSIFNDPARARYIREGLIYKSIASAESDYASAFAKRDKSKIRTFEFRKKEYDIISPTTVLFTGIGALEYPNADPKREPWVIAYTIVWILESDGWKAINMHISWE